MKKIISLFMAVVLCLMPMSAMAEATDGGMNAQLEAIMEIEPENMTSSQYFLFEHGFHSDEASADSVIFARRTSGGDALLARRGGTVYAGSEEVSGYAGNSEMVFYMAGDTIYRYHVRSRQTDAIYQGSGIVTWYPITSKVLLIGKNNGITASPLAPPICTDELDLEGLAYYEVDTEEKRIVYAEDPERSIFLTQGSGYTNLSSYSGRINGKSIPTSSYPINSVYNSSYNGSTQCAGFALYVYNYLWGSTGYGTSYYPNGSTVTNMIDNLYSKNDGARVRVSSSANSSSNGHSFIICEQRNREYVIVYHANWGSGSNVVRVTKFTYAQLYSYYPYVYYVQNP